MGFDRAPGCLRPEQHVRFGATVRLDDESASDFFHRLGLSGQPREPFRGDGGAE
jgi:hypothetical protein